MVHCVIFICFFSYCEFWKVQRQLVLVVVRVFAFYGGTVSTITIVDDKKSSSKSIVCFHSQTDGQLFISVETRPAGIKEGE